MTWRRRGVCIYGEDGKLIIACPGLGPRKVQDIVDSHNQTVMELDLEVRALQSDSQLPY